MCVYETPALMLCAPRSHVRLSSMVIVGFSRPAVLRPDAGFASVLPKLALEPDRLKKYPFMSATDEPLNASMATCGKNWTNELV